NDENEEIKTNEEILSENTEETENLSEEQEENQDNASLKVQVELAEQKDKYLRLYSEFENFRRRTSKEKLELIQSANEKLIVALLPVADDFERAEKSIKDRDDKDMEGLL